MSDRFTLRSEDRHFFSMVRAAIFTNPFSDERVAIDLQITGLGPDTPHDERVNALIQVVHERIRHLAAEGKATLDPFAGEDRELMENAFLFDFFHQFLTAFDELIPRQMAAGEKPIPAPFAGEALALLRKRGFPPGEARRYLEICYQLRRAYFFIFHGLVGRSPCMKRLRRDLWNNVFTRDIGLYNDHLWNRMEDFSTLILGGTGTGKGTAAAAIGRSGFIPFDEKKGCFTESFVRSFIPINLSQFPESLIESELFGHKKGAFTGAVEDHKGVFDRCSPHGAIFLDEIGEVAIPLQIKLLQVIQERSFRPVGSHLLRRFHGRVIAATNQRLDRLRREGRFRDDFFYRLCSDVIRVPTLSQRIQEDEGELDDLLAHTVTRILGKPSGDLTEMVRRVIDSQLGRGYPWPGNVRELEQCVRRVLLKGVYEGDSTSSARDLLSQLSEGMAREALDGAALVSGYCALLYQRHGTYEAVARRTQLDRRTVKKYIAQHEAQWKDKKGDADDQWNGTDR